MSMITAPAVAAAPLAHAADREAGSAAGASGGGAASLPTRIGDWMANRFGKAAMPIAMGVGGAAGAGLGFVTLGPVGAAVGGVAGAWLGMLVVGLRP